MSVSEENTEKTVEMPFFLLIDDGGASYLRSIYIEGIIEEYHIAGALQINYDENDPVCTINTDYIGELGVLERVKHKEEESGGERDSLPGLHKAIERANATSHFCRRALVDYNKP